MPKWFSSEEENDNPGKAVEKKFETLETTVKEIKDNSVSKQEFSTVAEGVAAINRRFAQEDEARTRREAEAKRQQRSEAEASYDPEKEFETFAADPKAYIARQSAPVSQATLLALGRQKRAEVLEGKPYYHGDFKREVDSAIESGTRDYAMLSNPEYILNCYRVVYGKYAEEDKIKDMKRSVSLEMAGDGSGSGREDKNAKPTVSFRTSTEYSDSKAKFAAQQLGITDEDVVKAAETGAIRGLEVLA